MTAKRTSGPLVLGKMGVIKGGPFHQFANGSGQSQLFMATAGLEMSHEEREANAAHMVMCWNTHDKLVAALRRYLNCDPARDVGGDTPAAQARAALAEADAEGGA
ncbi:hypothetical protein [Burkholderia vietnamiensis]|uniref:hypothetical protein n=1 Tax=Burkholderia vietnamiensis TaxID=60552 RepID=UPI001CAD5B20|nr:hypothetical protein [Burkholderia vietnamiensis]CAG9229320.1 hypothetical protein BVI1335_70190 [Burkholderia vietnamiensis]HDR9086285.1 hypothetical protein [Burkholderia vietnamiensis]